MIKTKSCKILTNTTFCLSIAGLMATSPAIVFAQQSGPIGFADIRVCEPGRIDVPQVLRDAPGGSPDEQPITIEADGIETDTDQRLILTGNAQVVQGKRGIYAERIEYDQEAYRARASGDVIYYTTGGDEIKADAMDIEVDTFIGDADNVNIKMVDTQPEFLVRSSEKFDEDYSVFAPLTRRTVTVDEPEEEEDEDGTDNEDAPKKKKEKIYYQRARAKAETMDIQGQGFEVLENAVMTTCPDGNQDVTLSASRLELDHASGIGNAKNMVVRLKNVPIFYFPTVTFPINDERKTGFLFPAIGNENDSGFTLETPYYINIAPQMDATITPRLLTERGVQIYSEFRYKATETDGAVRAEYLPGDDAYENEDRYAVGFDHSQTFADDWRLQVDIQDVSDVDYMRDFANNVDIVASSYIPQRATLARTGEYINFNAKVQSFESVNDQILESQLPYDILPAVNLNLKPQELGLFKTGMKNNFTQFEADDDTRVTGSRALLNPYVSMPLEKIYGYIRPKVGLHHISYSLDNPVDDSMEMAADDSPSASIPVFSIDSQVVFERLFNSGDTPYYQTLEPRLFYVNIPKETDQNAFPDFDTGETIPSSFGHFFRENRFFGGDRVGDTEQLTLGLSSRIINDDNGSQRMMLSLGQIFYLEDREIKLDPEAEPDTNDTSDFIGEITANITSDWSMSGFALYDNEESELGVIRASANYYNSPRRNAAISYTDVRDSHEQVNLRFETPLGPAWQFDVDTAYSLTDSELRSSAIGISYDGCCWALKATTQRFLDGRGEFNNRFLLTLELDDLGRIRGGL